jgi:hypothetical protein
MKKLIHIFFILLLIAFMVTCFQSCNNKTESSTTQTIALSESEITEAKLPKGKYVIEEVAAPFEKPIVITPVSGNNPRKNETTKSTSKPGETRGETLQKKYRNLLVFHADDTMEVNKPKLAVLVLAKNESVEKLKMEVLDESNAQDEKLKTDTTMDFGSKMKAKLIPFGGLENDFKIEPLGDDEQSFKADRKKILWQWKITPLKAGEHELKLTIQIIEKDGEAVSLPARNIPVVIFAKEEAFMSKVGNFFSTKYEWIITAVMIPLIIAFVSARVRNKSHKHSSTQADNKA